MKAIISAVLLVSMATFVDAQTQENHFVTIKFPHGITMDAPRSWKAVSAEEQEIMLTTVQAAIDLTGVKQTAKQRITLLKASPAVNGLYAYVKLSVNFGDFNNQKDLEKFTKADLKEYDRTLLPDIEKMNKLLGTKMVEWKGSRAEQINGKWALITEYRREDPAGFGPVWCQVNEILMGDKSVHLTHSYREREMMLLKPVILRIRSSLRIE